MTAPSERVTILTCVYNDWDSLAVLLSKLDRVLADRFPELTFEVLAINDRSSRWSPDFLSQVELKRIARVEVLHLHSNLGHQRAIAVGLAYVETRKDRAVVVMDADGEDDPEDVPRLLATCLEKGEEKIIFAERTLRSERLLFRFFYRIYQLLHRMLTGLPIKVGNFSVIPAKTLPALGVLSDMWNHYAATVYKSRIPFEGIPAKRAKRIQGDSTMNFSSLVIHGLSALSVHGELVATRLLVANGILACALVGSVAVVCGLYLAGMAELPRNFPLWTLGGAFLFVQSFFSSLYFAFMVLKARASTGFLPARDFHWYVRSSEAIAWKGVRASKAA